MKNILFLVFFFLQTIIYCQSIDSLFIKSQITSSSEEGYDSLGNKQGFWIEKIYYGEYLLFYEDSIEAFDATAYGFYKNDKKAGFWDIYTTNKNEERSLIAQIYYENDTMLYQFTYIDSKIHQYTQLGYVNRQYNTGASGVIYAKDRIVFDKNGNIKYRESYSPDGILEKKKY